MFGIPQFDLAAALMNPFQFLLMLGTAGFAVLVWWITPKKHRNTVSLCYLMAAVLYTAYISFQLNPPKEALSFALLLSLPVLWCLFQVRAHREK